MPLQATYPFRCGACNARFLVKLWSFGERVKRMKARPPRWVRTLVWVIAVGALGLVVALAMVALNSTSIPTPKAPPPLKK